jgi:Gpi18-like mannosyltransferase
MNECSQVQPRPWLDDLLLALAVYSLSTAVVLGAVVIGPYFIEFCDEHSTARHSSDLLAWDGFWYRWIAARGYTYDQERHSSVAFFPLYPLLSALVSRVTGLPVTVSLLLVSHASLALAFFMLLRYLRFRVPDSERSVWYYSLASAAFFPTTFYWRMAYTESLFLLLAVVVLYGIERGWKPFNIALWIGLATATRLTAVALLAPLAYEVWRKHSQRKALRTLVVLAPVSIWGISLYVVYQAWEFGEPLAFQKTQINWHERQIPDSLSAIVADFLTFESIRGVYRPECECYWGNVPPRDSAALSMRFMNPIYVLLTAGLVGLGWERHWLNHKEVLLCVLLLLIAYVLQGYRTCMASQARYVSVAFPQYIVIGHLLARLPYWASVVLIAVSGGVLAIYAAMFTSWYWYY